MLTIERDTAYAKGREGAAKVVEGEPVPNMPSYRTDGHGDWAGDSQEASLRKHIAQSIRKLP